MARETTAAGTEIIWGDPWEMEPCTLLPAEAFAGSDDVPRNIALRRRWGAPDEETGEHSRTVTWRFFSCTAGWPHPPTASDLYVAIRAPAPTRWQRAVIRAWLDEATYAELMLAWLEEAYSWQELVAAAHRIGYGRYGVCRWLNSLARESGRADADTAGCPVGPRWHHGTVHRGGRRADRTHLLMSMHRATNK